MIFHPHRRRLRWMEVKVDITMSPHKWCLITVLVAGMMPPALAASMALDTDIYDSAKLTAFCVMGSMLGAFIAVALFPPVGEETSVTVRRLALKFASSLATGLLIAPWAIYKYPEMFGVHPGEVPQPSAVVLAAGLFSFCGIGALHKLMPWVSHINQNRRDRHRGGGDPPTTNLMP